MIPNSICRIVACLCFITFFSCASNKKLVVPIEPEYESVMLDTLTISPEDGISDESEEDEFSGNPYQSSSTRYFDLMHTKLDLKFDWTNQWVIGKASLDLTPLAYAQDSLVLDAKNMDVSSVLLRENKAALKYKNNGSQLTIYLTKSYLPKEILKVDIDYIAKPNTGSAGGSAAITSDKGLFFINPLNTEPGKPQQIWSQGETENNSRWFPTIDKPNERCSQEVSLTVEDKFVTLSNGKLLSSQKNNDGTRTDYWKQEKPHAPYLFMIAIGEYAVVKDKWNDLSVEYYVEKPYAPYAKQIFNHTPEMIGFFSELFDYPFPWDKYSQIITRDYVSGAMENTGAVVFGDFVQKTDREMIDNDNDMIVAHELSHHWFGDLVTIESWANLTLNEGFANYAEYLWSEHKYGKMKADEHRQNELNGYLTSTYNGGMHPLIHYRYSNREDMFDAHSYNKGGLVLHYLRSYLGDAVFFESLKNYLDKYQYTAVEVDELRIAFEDASGEDLHWFFDQFYMKKGHPEMTVSYAYSETDKTLNVKIVQDPAGVFMMPVDIALYDNNGRIQYKRIWTKTGEDNIILENIDVRPAAMVFDGKSVIPGHIIEIKSPEEWLATFQFSNQFSDKYQAMQSIDNEDPLKIKLLERAINDPYYYFRDYAVNTFALLNLTNNYKDVILRMITNDAHSQVRESALRSLANIESADKSSILKVVFANEKSFNVLGEALVQQHIINAKDAIDYCTLLEKENVVVLDNKIASIYAESIDPKYNAWYQQKIKGGNAFALFELCGYYNIYLLNQSENVVKQAIENYAALGKNTNTNKYNRYIGTASLFSLKNMLISQKAEKGKDSSNIVKIISEQIKAIKIQEKDDELIERYAEF